MFRRLTLVALWLLLAATSASFALQVPDDLAKSLEHAKEALATHASQHPLVPRDDKEDETRHLQTDDGDDERFPRCSICPDGQAMSNEDVVLVTDDATGTETTCADARFLGARGIIEPADCPVLQAAFASECGCVAESVSGANARCSVCTTPGHVMGNPNRVAASNTESGTEFTCQDLDDFGYARELSAAFCTQVRDELQGPSACDCTSVSESGPATSNPEPVSSPTSAAPQPASTSTPAEPQQQTSPTAAPTQSAPTPPTGRGPGGSSSGLENNDNGDDGNNNTIIIAIVIVLVVLIVLIAGGMLYFYKRTPNHNNHHGSSGNTASTGTEPHKTSVPMGGQPPVYAAAAPYAHAPQQQPYVYHPSHKQGAEPDVTVHSSIHDDGDQFHEPQTQIYDL